VEGSTSRSRNKEQIIQTNTRILPKYGIYGLELTADQNPNQKVALIQTLLQGSQDNQQPTA
jgi:hypothetical protein